MTLNNIIEEAKKHMKEKRDFQWAYQNNLTILNDEELYNDMLNEVYGMVNIAGLEYDASTAQYNVDPTAYQCGLNSYISGRLEDGDISELEDGTLVPTSELESLDSSEE